MQDNIAGGNQSNMICGNLGTYILADIIVDALSKHIEKERQASEAQKRIAFETSKMAQTFYKTEAFRTAAQEMTEELKGRLLTQDHLSDLQSAKFKHGPFSLFKKDIPRSTLEIGKTRATEKFNDLVEGALPRSDADMLNVAMAGLFANPHNANYIMPGGGSAFLHEIDDKTIAQIARLGVVNMAQKVIQNGQETDPQNSYKWSMVSDRGDSPMLKGATKLAGQWLQAATDKISDDLRSAPIEHLRSHARSKRVGMDIMNP